ncbi:MAG: hypothetical protein NTV06_03635 [candidate division Zixibacteria bacterium]|nr:hypothetical protein [candidate division Zixibacteria bacterium]
MNKEKEKPPLAIRILAWYGMAFGAMYILYSVVNIILAIMDRTYSNIGTNFVFGLCGIPILLFSLALRDQKRWGWVGYLVVFLLVIIISIWGHKDIYDMITGLTALAALVGLFLPSVRERFVSF